MTRRFGQSAVVFATDGNPWRGWCGGPADDGRNSSRPIGGVVRAQCAKRLPVVLPVDEVWRVMTHLTGDEWTIAMPYGGGLPLAEPLSLRVTTRDVVHCTWEGARVADVQVCQSMFRVEFTPEAVTDLQSFRKYDQERVVGGIAAQLTHQATQP